MVTFAFYFFFLFFASSFSHSSFLASSSMQSSLSKERKISSLVNIFKWHYQTILRDLLRYFFEVLFWGTFLRYFFWEDFFKKYLKIALPLSNGWVFLKKSLIRNSRVSAPISTGDFEGLFRGVAWIELKELGLSYHWMHLLSFLPPPQVCLQSFEFCMGDLFFEVDFEKVPQKKFPMR